MFRLFSKKANDRCPVSDENRQWLEASFFFLLDQFDRQKTRQRKLLTPHFSDFPIQYDGSEQTAIDTLRIIAQQMEIDPETVRLDLYTDGIGEISKGDPWGGRFFLTTDENEKQSAGLYFGRQEDNLYHIALERRKLTQPENMIATLAHELAHIKLLGEERISENDEKLTDLTTVIFGLGIFNANAAFQTFSNYGSSGWRKMGYLTQMEWGYALALLAFLRGELSPEWAQYLSLNVRSDLKQGLRFIDRNKQTIFVNQLV